MKGVQVKYTPFTGGLDASHSALTVEDGRMIQCQNFEQIFGQQGYRRIDGYERFDGRPQPHRATYIIQNFDAGVTEITVGQVVTGAAVSAQVVSVTLESGAWDGSASGTLILTEASGDFVDDEAIKVLGSTVATASGDSINGTIADPDYAVNLNASREFLRGYITKVPGSGPIRGGFVYDGDAYAFRDAEDGLTCALYKSSLSGWTSVKTGLIPGGFWRASIGNFTGDTRELAVFLVDGKNRSAKFYAGTYTEMVPIWGSQSTSTTSFTIGTGSKAFVVVEDDRSYTVGDDVIAHDTASAANWMRGLVTSWDSGTKTLTVNVTTTGGSGTLASWVIGSADYSDKPFLVNKHKDHLMLAYPNGQLQTSNLGDPMVYTTTAALFGMGDEITGIVSLKGDVMGIYCRNSTHILNGFDLTSWQMQVHSTSAGGVLNSVQEVGGNVFAIDDRGVTSMQATQAYGDFEISVMSRDVQPLIAEMLPLAVDSVVSKSKYQYWLYLSDGTVVTTTVLSPEAVIQPKDVSYSIAKYPHQPSCAFRGELADGSEVFFMGTTDGYLMREDVGSSFDGGSIPAVLRIPFAHFKSPANKKRFRKMVLEINAPERTSIRFKQAFDYSDGVYTPSLNQSAETTGSGGLWDSSAWDEFYWSLPSQSQAEANISGVGRNMSLLLWHDTEIVEPFVLQGLLIHYSILGIVR